MSTSPAQRPYRPDPGGGCPHAANAALLARTTVTDVVLPGEIRGMMVLGHETLKEFLSRTDVAKSPAHFTALREGRIPEGWPLLAFAVTPGMLTSDGEQHRRLRSLVSKAFTARRVDSLRPRVEAITAELLDGLAEAAGSAGGGAVDLRAHYAMPLPMSVICELFGVDPEFRRRLHELSHLVVSTSISPADAVAAGQELIAVLGTVVARRADRPGDDLTSALIATRAEDGDRLTEQELIGTLVLFVIAGHETTLNLITNAVRALCADRSQLELVRSGAAGWMDVVEETLRWDSPVSYFPFRYPVGDIDVDGTLIPRGTPVLAGYSAAGRDPSAHGPDAGRFDVLRPSRPGAARHLSLGHGAHFCLGAPLARMEAAVALRALFERFPGLEPAVAAAELPRHTSFVGNSVERLPVRLGS
ncbi:cytochrome P450 [Streptomyces sp. NPDC057638]|uniref:cytochrome P450 family protein n=1 Tax=Streptomyces sp. NPDC057638 TaxID=3346190 RepID=UPI0036859FAD